MTNEVVKKPSVFGGNVSMVNSTQLAERLAESAQRDPRGAAADGSDYMNFSGKTGRYEIGVNKDDADPDEVWLINIAAFEDGYVCWKDNRPAATRLYPMGSTIPPVDRSEHGPFTREGDGWYEAKSLTAKSVDTGKQVYFKNNSVSGVSEFAQLQKQVLARIRAGQAAWPLVNFRKDTFQSKGFKNFKPILRIAGWLSDEACEKLAAAFEDENTQIDLEELITMSSAPSSLVSPERGNAEPEVAKRNRRQL